MCDVYYKKPVQPPLSIDLSKRPEGASLIKKYINIYIFTHLKSNYNFLYVA